MASPISHYAPPGSGLGSDRIRRPGASMAAGCGVCRVKMPAEAQGAQVAQEICSGFWASCGQLDREADPILPSRCPVYRTQFLGNLGILAGGGHLEGGHAKWRRGVACQWWLVGSVAPCSRARYDTLTASQPDPARVRGFLCPLCQRLYTEGKPGMRGVSGHRGFSGGIEPLT